MNDHLTYCTVYLHLINELKTALKTHCTSGAAWKAHCRNLKRVRVRERGREESGRWRERGNLLRMAGATVQAQWLSCDERGLESHRKITTKH